jgi:hypothetical protein
MVCYVITTAWNVSEVVVNSELCVQQSFDFAAHSKISDEVVDDIIRFNERQMR